MFAMSDTFQEHDLEAMKSQVELNKLVIEDLHNKLRDSLALVDKLEVGVAFGHPVACNYFDCHFQAELQQERMKNASRLPSHPADAQSTPSASESGSLPQVAPGSRLNEALSILTALRQSIRP
jgi:hypothetical protein